VLSLRQKAQKEEYDERILGSGDFVQAILKKAEEKERRQMKIRRVGLTLSRLIEEEVEKSGSSAESVGKKVELYLLEQVSKGLTVSLAFKCLAGLQPFFTPATVLKQPVESSICLFRSEGEKYQVILGMQNLGNRRHYSIYVVPRSKKCPQILRKRQKSNVSLQELKNGSRRKVVSRTRAKIARRGIEELGLSCAELALHLGVCTSSISRVIAKTGGEDGG